MKRIHSLYYHNPNVNGFEKMIVHYLNRGYRFISIRELYEVIIGKVPFPDKNVFLSLDDGWKENLTLIPIIEKYNVPICIFVATEPLCSGNFWWEYVKNEEGLKKMFEFKNLPFDEFQCQLSGFRQRNILERSAITMENLKTLNEHPLVTIQSHSVNHPILTSVPDEVLETELLESKKELESLTDANIYAFSYPNGSLTHREVDACKQYYKIAFTTEQRHINESDDIFQLPRYALTGDYKRDLLKVWGIWKYIKKFRNYGKNC